MIIENLEDDSLIFLYMLNDAEALNALLERYKRKSKYLVNEIVENVDETGVTTESLVNVALECVEVCIKNFEFGREKYTSYWKTCAIRRIYDYLKENSYLQKARNLVGISIDSCMIDEDFNQTLMICDCICSPQDYSDVGIVDKYADAVKRDEIYLPKKIEKQVFLAYLKGHTMKEVTGRYNITKSHYYRIVKKGKDLFKKMYSN